MDFKIRLHFKMVCCAVLLSVCNSSFATENERYGIVFEKAGGALQVTCGNLSKVFEKPIVRNSSSLAKVGNFFINQKRDIIYAGISAVIVGGAYMFYKRLNTTIEDLQEQINAGNVTITGLQEQINAGNVTIEDLQEQVNAGNVTIEGLQEQVDAGNETITGLQEQVNAGNVTITGLQEQVEELDNKLSNIMLEIISLREANEGSPTHMSLDMKDFAERVHTQTDDLVKRVDNLKIRVEKQVMPTVESIVNRMDAVINVNNEMQRALEKHINESKDMGN